MSEQQKASHLKKISQTPVTSVLTVEDLPDETALDSIGLSVDFESASADLPISSGVFEGIWKKASELLMSEGAIATAPGLASQARTVISKTRPGFHTVVPGKGGRFACDNCPNYKSLGICSHMVAVAEVNGMLSDFLDWFRRSKNVTPNLTKLLTSDMPQGRGRKGGKGPRKRKAPSIVGIISGHSYGNTFDTLVFPEATESQQSIPSCAAQQSRPPPPLIHAASSSPQSESDHDQFELVFLTKRVKKCYGCSKEFVKQPDGSNLQPPYDIVVRHADFREYYYDGEKRSTKQKQNTYFHPCLTCISSKCSSFNFHSLDTSSVKDELLPVHIAFLKNNFPGLQI